MISVLGCWPPEEKGAVEGVLWSAVSFLSEARAELDFCNFVGFGHVNIYFFSPTTQVACSCCP